MSGFFRYFCAQVKRLCVAFKSVLFVSLLTGVCILLLAAVFVHSAHFSGTKQQFSIGIVCDDTHSYLDAAIASLQMVDSSRFFVNFEQLSLSDAEDRLRRGLVTAYVIIPEGFFASVESGKNDKQVCFVTASGPEGFESLVKEEAANIVTTLLTHAQAGVFAMENLALENGSYARLNRYLYELNMKYVNWTLDRAKFARVEELGLSKQLSVQTYYLCSALLVFLTLLSISVSALFASRSSASFRFMCSRGISAPVQLAGEYCAYLLFMLVLLALAFLALCALAACGKLTVFEWRYIGEVHGLLRLGAAFVPVCMLLSSIHLLLFELAPGVVSAVLLHCISAFVLCFCGGCFYPLDFFPLTMQHIGNLQPLGCALSFVTSAVNAFSGEERACRARFCALGAYTALFFSLCVLLRRMRIRGRA